MVVALLVLAGCGGDGVKTFDEPEGTIEVQAGEEFRFDLGENPSTGYLWRFTRRPDPSVVRVLGDDFELEEGGEDRDGAGGTRRFTFRAGRPGRTRIAMEDVFTGGERGRRPVDTLDVTVVVEP